MEAQEHADFRHTAALCHEYGIKALPYLQYQNILQESMYPEAPCWSEDVFGKARYYASYRRTLCQSSKAFRDYIKALIRSSQQDGADGIWIDNTYLHPCFCPECRKALLSPKVPPRRQRRRRNAATDRRRRKVPLRRV